MLACPPKKSEDTMENYIAFEPRKWKASQKEERVYVTDMCGGLTEVFCLGDWHKNWHQIDSPHMALQKETDYMFTFWLNGGENDRRQETCKLKIYFAGDTENPMVFRLNRHYIKPERHNNGWYRYQIPFTVPGSANDPDADIIPVMLQFAAMDAHCAIMPDKPEFAQLPNEDTPDKRIPQRHNIVFEDGFPRDAWWSYLIFGDDVAIQNSNDGSSMIDKLAAIGFDLESAMSDLPPEDKAQILNNIIGNLHMH